MIFTAIAFIQFNSDESVAGPSLKEEVESLSPHVTSVKVCGHWEYKGKQGQYRIISGWIYGHSEIYIQWLADPDIDTPTDREKKDDFEVMHTSSFPRFNDYESATDITEPSCRETPAGTEIIFDAHDGHSNQKAHVVIKLNNEFGKFTLSETMRSN